MFAPVVCFTLCNTYTACSVVWEGALTAFCCEAAEMFDRLTEVCPHEGEQIVFSFVLSPLFHPFAVES